MSELTWPGKYRDQKKQGPVRIALPFQTIETVNESAQERQRDLELFAKGQPTDWRNRLIWGDKKYILPSLLPEFPGKVDLIYVDPPFATGQDFSFPVRLADHDFVKEPSMIEVKAYRDTWGRGLDGYLEWFYETVVLLRDYLAETGSLWVHLDWHVGHYAKVILDEVFGTQGYVSEIVWKRTSSHNDPNRPGNIHDTLYWYARSSSWTWNQQYQPLDKEYVEKVYTQKDARGIYRLDNLTAPGISRGVTGNVWRTINPTSFGRHWRRPPDELEKILAEGGIQLKADGVPSINGYKQYLSQSKGMPLQSIWADLPNVAGISSEKLGYSTQKPETLLSRIVSACSNEGDLVLDCFVGSGTTAAVAEKLGRRWIACDLSRFAIHISRKRLLGIPHVKPFIVQNLGKYERQAWQVAEFPGNGKGRRQEQLQREGAYRQFILELYHATPIAGQWLHGMKSGRAVHVGAVDAPITLADVKAVSGEAWKLIASAPGSTAKAAVDILGWDFALEVNELAKQVAARSRVQVTLKKIPIEVLDRKAVEQGDVRFFELAALSVSGQLKGRELRLQLSDFVIPTDDIPEEARRAVKHWSQLVDYWAVDWEYRDDTFHNQWQAYRTRSTPNIEVTAVHTYSEPSTYGVVVKVIDILGNDTTKALEFVVR